MPEISRLIIVSGLSGSGKSVALHALEDLGFYCIDNMPAGLLRALLDEIAAPGAGGRTRVAVGVDARNRHDDLESLPDVIADLKKSGYQTDVLFLQASDDVLLKRYSETRRRHPLEDDRGGLRGAIQRERELLGAVINAADLVIDSSRTSVYELADTIRERVDRRKARSLSILIQSFGFKHGIPSDADFVFDLRCLPNPYWQPELRRLTGLDREVADFLEQQDAFVRMCDDIHAFLARWIPEYVSFNRSYLTVALGCTGGQHRSVYMTEKLARALRDSQQPILTRHNELASQPTSAD